MILIDGVDAGLKNLNDLNDRTQKLELILAKEIRNQTESIGVELTETKIKLMGDIDTLIKAANKKSEDIDTLHNDFKILVEQAGIYELTRNYKLKADEEKKDYKLNMWLTVAAIIMAVVATIVVITIPIVEHWKSNPPVNIDYFTLFARLSISLMFFVLALYTSKQAAKHYECYQENHRTFLQLAALEPFMSRMTPEEQKEIRKGLIPSYFNQGTEGKYASKGDEVDISTNMYSLFSQTLSILADKKESKAENDKAETN